MDTRSKNFKRLKNMIITLVILVPALVLVLLYPAMEDAMLDKRKVYEELNQQLQENMEQTSRVNQNFLNYAMETSYCVYGELLKESGVTDLNFAVLQEYGWMNDYRKVDANTAFHAYYANGEETLAKDNLKAVDDVNSKVILQFDENGELTQFDLDGDIVEDIESPYEILMRSVEQYQNNVSGFNARYGTSIDAEELRPKNFTIVFQIEEGSYFVEHYSVYEGCYYGIDSLELYVETGSFWIVIGLAIVVAMVALLLPFVKSLRTGREKLFLIPGELVFVLGFVGVFAAVLMFRIMSESNVFGLNQLIEIYGAPELLGKPLSFDVLYVGLLVLNFIGWSFCFFLDYVVFSCIRNFLAHPIVYLKERTIVGMIWRRVRTECQQLYSRVTSIDLNNHLNKRILEVVIINFIILTIMCSLWFFGVLGLIIYSIILYLVLHHFGEKIQTQYRSVLHATKRMAEGDLKISLDEDLGVFQELGESLGQIQQGFEQAVVEEAKSQNMKTELITNVSHDLKTPLTAIITYVNLLKKEDLTEEERKSYIQTLDLKSQRLKVLIEDLFEISKAQSGNVKMNFMDVDVVSLLKQVRSEMASQIEQSTLVFRWNLPEERVILSLDGQRMYRVFENLINNILKYAMPHSRVYIDINCTDTQVQFLFRNISAEEIASGKKDLTERFVRGDSSRNTEGSGLGLAIVKSFVELQHGTFEVEVDGDLFKANIVFLR